MTAASPAPAELDAMLRALGSVAAAGTDRHAAMAKFLSGSDEWRDAKAVLRGSFARGHRRPGKGPKWGQG